MHKWKTGKLHSGGPGGPKVTSQKQAVAIMKSEERTEAKHGGHYPEKSYFQGGSTMSKSSGLHDASYAMGGSVLPRSRDFKKEPDDDLLGGVDRFTGHKATVAGGKVTTDDVFGKGSGKANPKPADKSEAPVKPRR
jgi:hypothetical protein